MSAEIEIFIPIILLITNKIVNARYMGHLEMMMDMYHHPSNYQR